MAAKEKRIATPQESRVDVKVPSNFRSYRTGFKCPHCQHEIKRSLRGRSAKHKVKCRFCSEEIMVHIYYRSGKNP